MISKQEFKKIVDTNLVNLPLEFKFLKLQDEVPNETNDSHKNVGEVYKPATAATLQSNDIMVGSYHKPINRFIVSLPEAKPTEALANVTDATSNETPVKAIFEPNKYFRLFAHCIPVKGAARATICDLQRQHFHFIPNVLYDILTDVPKTYNEVIAYCGEENREVLEEYYSFLQEHEYGYWFDKEELDLFPPMSMDWRQPFMVSNCILDYDASSHYDIKAVIQQLDALGCTALQLRFFAKMPKQLITDVLQCMDNSMIRTVDILLPYSTEFTNEDIDKLVEQYLRIGTFTIYNAPYSQFKESLNDKMSRVIYTVENINSETHCGAVQSFYFVVNTNLFTESQHHNNCLNRKIGVDKSGLIKNCPSMTESFGHISNVSLDSVLQQQDFKKKWNITKDTVEVCRDCEFRYICTDCRAYTTGDNASVNGKPAKCQYNPYEAIWEQNGAVESAHMALQQ